MPVHIMGGKVLAVSRQDKRINAFIQGGTIPSFSLPSEITSIAPNAFDNISGLTEVIFTNQEEVVDVSSSSGIGANVKFVVPSQLLSDYETAYPDRTIVSYESGYQWVIPYVSGETSTTLTSAYINECLMANPDAKKAFQVVVPSYFTDNEMNCYDALPSNFTKIVFETSGTRTFDYGILSATKPYVGALEDIVIKVLNGTTTITQHITEFPSLMTKLSVNVAENAVFVTGEWLSNDTHLQEFSVIGQGSMQTQTKSCGFAVATRLYFQLSQNSSIFVQYPNTDFRGKKVFILIPNNTTADISNFKDSSTRIYFWADKLVWHLTEPTWSYFADTMVGVLDYTDTVPTFSGYTATWYEDEDCTVTILPENFISGHRYYVKLS